MYLCALCPFGGAGPPYPFAPKLVTSSFAPEGILSGLTSSASTVVDAGTSQIIQWIKRSPGKIPTLSCSLNGNHSSSSGTSGSTMVRAKLFVPFGALLHFNGGERFWPPSTPHAPFAYLVGMIPCSIIWGDVRTNIGRLLLI